MSSEEAGRAEGLRHALPENPKLGSLYSLAVLPIPQGLGLFTPAGQTDGFILLESVGSFMPTSFLSGKPGNFGRPALGDPVLGAAD